MQGVIPKARARSGACQLVPSSRYMRQGPPVALGPGVAPGASSPAQPARWRRDDSLAAFGVPPEGSKGGGATPRQVAMFNIAWAGLMTPSLRLRWCDGGRKRTRREVVGPRRSRPL